MCLKARLAFILGNHRNQSDTLLTDKVNELLIKVYCMRVCLEMNFEGPV